MPDLTPDVTTTPNFDPGRVAIASGWLVYDVGYHTCGGYGPESGYAHEPGCGAEPICKVADIPDLLAAAAERDALADRLDIAEAGLDRVAVAMGCGDEVDGRGVYRDDVDGMIEYATTLRQAARDHDECPVLCAEHDGPEAWEWPMSCQDCRGSGMAGPSAIDFIDGVVPDNLAHPGECESCAGSGRDCNSIHNLVTMDDARQMTAVVLDDLAVAEARMADVRALHFGEYVEDEDRSRCFECGDEWPCPTIRALDTTPETGGES